MTREEIIAENPIADFLRNRGHELKPAGDNFVTNACPVTQHKRFHRPVSIDTAKGLFHCNDCDVGGSIIDWVIREKNISVADALRELGGGRNGQVKKSKRRIAATYDYHDENGKLLFQTVRYVPKDFAQRHPDGRGEWIDNIQGVRRVLYRLPQVIAAQTVIVTEGEKDADNLRSLGFVATTNPVGAEKWRAEYSEMLRDKNVVICGDTTDKGPAHVEQVISSLSGIARSIKRVALPNGFKDVSDYIESISPVAQKRIITKLIDSTPEIAVRQNSAAVKTDDSAQIRGCILEILRDGNLQRREQFALVAEAVTSALGARGQFFFHAEQKDFSSAMFFDNQRKRLELIQSDSLWRGSASGFASIAQIRFSNLSKHKSKQPLSPAKAALE